MRDDDLLLNLPESEFGSGVVGVCDICGKRQAVVVLTKERFKVCVIDFLNKTWVKTDKKPGVPAPLYRSERVWFETRAVPKGTAQGILLKPSKLARHPAVLVTPDLYGLTTTLLDGAIRFAREGFEVFLPDVTKIDGLGSTQQFSMWSGARLRGGVPVESKRIAALVHLYRDALDFLRGRDMVDPAKTAVFGASYGATLALALAAQDTRLGAVALAYPMPVRPPDLAKLVTAPLLYVAGSEDRETARAREQLFRTRDAAGSRFEFRVLTEVRHHFLARDLPAYDVAKAEEAWGYVVRFLQQTLIPPPPRPPAPPVAKPDPAAPKPGAALPPKPAAAPTPAPAPRAPTASPA